MVFLLHKNCSLSTFPNMQAACHAKQTKLPDHQPPPPPPPPACPLLQPSHRHQPLSTTPQVVKILSKHQISQPLWVILTSGVIGLGGLALLWHRLTSVRDDVINGRDPIVKGGVEYGLLKNDIDKIQRIIDDVEAALLTHGLKETFDAWSPPNMDNMGECIMNDLHIGLGLGMLCGGPGTHFTAHLYVCG